jgi:hypothetical protein
MPMFQNDGSNQALQPTADRRTLRVDNMTTDHRLRTSLVVVHGRSIPNLASRLPWMRALCSTSVFTKTDSSASLGALAMLGTSRRKIRSLRTVPAVLLAPANDSAFSR